MKELSLSIVSLISLKNNFTCISLIWIKILPWNTILPSRKVFESTLHKIQKCHSFGRVLGEWLETLRKLCISPKFLQQETRWIPCILRSGALWIPIALCILKIRPNLKRINFHNIFCLYFVGINLYGFPGKRFLIIYSFFIRKFFRRNFWLGSVFCLCSNWSI